MIEIPAAGSFAPGARSGPPATEVVFGDGRRPEEATQVRLGDWEGPLGLLLTLIEARRLDILSVPLGAVAGAYLEALATLDGDRITNVSAFVAVASQLILIKSRAMLPRHADPGDPATLPDEGPDPEVELRRRLLLYRAYRDAGALIQETAIRTVGPVPPRSRGCPGRGRRGCPHPGRAAARSREPRGRPGRAGVHRRPAGARFGERHAIRHADATSRASSASALRSVPSIVLQELLRDVRDRVVIAVTFLAMLELVKRREIVVEQADPFGPIRARLTTSAERGPAAPAGGDDLALDESMAGFR